MNFSRHNIEHIEIMNLETWIHMKSFKLLLASQTDIWVDVAAFVMEMLPPELVLNRSKVADSLIL